MFFFFFTFIVVMYQTSLIRFIPSLVTKLMLTHSEAILDTCCLLHCVRHSRCQTASQVMSSNLALIWDRAAGE